MTSLVSRDRAKPRFEVAAHASQFSRKVSINVENEKITTVFASDSVMHGNMTLRSGFKLDGHIQGNLTFGVEDGLGIISKSATLQGDLRGPRAMIMGTVEGDIYIHGLLMLSPTAIVLGNIFYDRLVVHDGAQISGAMHMNGNTQSTDVTDSIDPPAIDGFAAQPSRPALSLATHTRG